MNGCLDKIVEYEKQQAKQDNLRPPGIPVVESFDDEEAAVLDPPKKGRKKQMSNRAKLAEATMVLGRGASKALEDCVVCSKAIANGEAWECAKCLEQMHAPGTQGKGKRPCTKGRKHSSPWCRKCDAQSEKAAREARKQPPQTAAARKQPANKAANGKASPLTESPIPRASSIATLMAMKPGTTRKRKCPDSASNKLEHTLHIGDKAKGKQGQDADTGTKLEFDKYYCCTVVKCIPGGYIVAYKDEPDRHQECYMALIRACAAATWEKGK